MGEVSFIDTSDVPAGRYNGARVQLAEETLRRAMQQNKTVRVALAPDERATTVVGAYHAAAKRIGIVVVVTAGPKRVYTNMHGRQAREASVLYFTLTRKAVPAANGQVRVPISPGEPQRTFAHGVEVTR